MIYYYLSSNCLVHRAMYMRENEEANLRTTLSFLKSLFVNPYDICASLDKAEGVAIDYEMTFERFEATFVQNYIDKRFKILFDGVLITATRAFIQDILSNEEAVLTALFDANKDCYEAHENIENKFNIPECVMDKICIMNGSCLSSHNKRVFTDKFESICSKFDEETRHYFVHMNKMRPALNVINITWH